MTKRANFRTNVGFDLERTKRLRFEYDKARAQGATQFWFSIGFDPKLNEGVEIDMDIDYAERILSILEPQFGIHVLQNRSTQ